MNPNEITFEPEMIPTEPQTDGIWLLNDDGELVEQEVGDDVEDD